MDRTKPFPISKRQVWEAWKKVKANQGGAGVDGQTIEAFEAKVGDNLYKLWNRMASGSYHPPPVRRVEIPKADGGVRPLGVPTVEDRVAQTVVKEVLEPELEKHFHPDSYGYRPGKSAHQALGQARERCWRSDWVLDLDIRSFFDTLDHDLLLRAVRRHTDDTFFDTRHMGGAVYRAMAEGPGSASERGGRRAGSRHAPRGCRKSAACQSFPALCVRYVDGTTLPDHPLRALCR